MAYADKQKEKEARRKWIEANADKVKAMRERQNEKRREKRREFERRALETGEKLARRTYMSPEERAANRRALQLKWHKEHYKETYEQKKTRMKTDPEYAAKVRALWTEKNAKRDGKAKEETPEQRARRLQRQREYKVRKRKEKNRQKELAAQAQALPKEVAQPTPKQPPKFEKKKPGRLMALAGWYRF